MIIVYRPELENPPMDKECTIGFSFIQGNGAPEYIQISSGVTRDFSEDTWERIQSYDVVKSLLSLGAIRVEANDKAKIAEDTAEVIGGTQSSIADLSITQVMGLVEDSFDIQQLEEWGTKEQRIKVRNAIAKRIASITEGNG